MSRDITRNFLSYFPEKIGPVRSVGRELWNRGKIIRFSCRDTRARSRETKERGPYEYLWNILVIFAGNWKIILINHVFPTR